MDYLDFEKPVTELENQIKELQNGRSHPQLDISKEIEALQSKVNQLIHDIYSNLTPWEKVLLSRHPQRPHASDFIQGMITQFHELSGDRFYSNDQAVIAGFGYLGDLSVAVVAIEKGRKTKEKLQRNFGMPRPEGYRKAIRVMKLAAQFGLPIISLVDTPGAYPGIDAEERGQAQAISENLVEMIGLKVPFVSVIIGEGGSGGALGVACGDRVHMLEYSIYSVISPESCASILWSDPKLGERAANALKLSPKTALDLQVIDSIIVEPIGGAHRNPPAAFENVKNIIMNDLLELKTLPEETLLQKRFEKYRRMGNLTLLIDKADPLKIYL
jgi:acetyl-CoA carboxylase carboxyl transferase subunit alpha